MTRLVNSLLILATMFLTANVHNDWARFKEGSIFFFFLMKCSKMILSIILNKLILGERRNKANERLIFSVY